MTLNFIQQSFHFIQNLMQQSLHFIKFSILQSLHFIKKSVQQSDKETDVEMVLKTHPFSFFRIKYMFKIH